MANNYVLFKEKTYANWLYKIMKKYKKQFVYLLKTEQKDFTSFNLKLKTFLNSMVEAMADYLPKPLQAVINKWVSSQKDLNPNFWISWDLRNEPAVVYLKNLKELHLSQRDWSIAPTTIKEIIWILKNWLEKWMSYTDIAEDIVKLDPFVFSQSRAELIAVTEVWRAYEYWKWLPMKDLQNQWFIVLKKWQTVNDERVRESHRQNQRDWYIPLDIPFSWTWDLLAPAKKKQSYRCRCSVIYQIK